MNRISQSVPKSSSLAAISRTKIAPRRTCGSVRPHRGRSIIGHDKSTVESSENLGPQIRSAKTRPTSPSSSPSKMATPSAISAPIGRRLLLLFVGAKAPTRLPSLAFPGRAAPSLRRSLHAGPNNNRVSGLSVLFCTEHFDVDGMERSSTAWRRGGMILIGEKRCLDVILFVLLRLLSVVVRIFRWLGDFSQ